MWGLEVAWSRISRPLDPRTDRKLDWKNGRTDVRSVGRSVGSACENCDVGQQQATGCAPPSTALATVTSTTVSVPTLIVSHRPGDVALPRLRKLNFRSAFSRSPTDQSVHYLREIDAPGGATVACRAFFLAAFANVVGGDSGNDESAALRAATRTSSDC